jgi:hypothetical protein
VRKNTAAFLSRIALPRASGPRPWTASVRPCVHAATAVPGGGKFLLSRPCRCNRGRGRPIRCKPARCSSTLLSVQETRQGCCSPSQQRSTFGPGRPAVASQRGWQGWPACCAWLPAKRSRRRAGRPAVAGCRQFLQDRGLQDGQWGRRRPNCVGGSRCGTKKKTGRRIKVGWTIILIFWKSNMGYSLRLRLLVVVVDVLKTNVKVKILKYP